MSTNPTTDAAIVVAGRFLENIESVIRGKHDEIKLVLAAFACKGHVLFEDVPGTAKTVLARAIARSVEGAVHQRIQCTPDLQPTDVTGLSVYNQQSRDFEFRPGPSSRTPCSWTRSTGRCRRRNRRCSRRWPSGR
jgi:MoxR-like ATPase